MQIEGLKILKVTLPDGVSQFIPFNRTNLDYHTTRRRYVSREKQERYFIEEVVVSWKEAAELGFSEAIQKLSPPKKTEAQQTNETLTALLKQNAELIAALTGAKTPKKSENNG